MDFGNGNLLTITGVVSTWTLTVSVDHHPNLFDVTAGDSILASYVPGNGFLASYGAVSLAVTPRPLTITAQANTKTADGTTSAAAIPTVSGLLASDTITGLSETYDTPNVGTGKTLTPHGTGERRQ